MRVLKMKSMLVLGWLLFCSQSAGAQVSLELESGTTFFVAPDDKNLLTRKEYEDSYREDNRYQASNALTITIKHFGVSAGVVDSRKKASSDIRSKTEGPVVHISISFVRPMFDANYLSFAGADRTAIQNIFAKFKTWQNSSSASPTGTQLRRPFPATMLWPVATLANNVVTLTELPLLFMRDSEGKSVLMFEKDKDFPDGLEKTAPATDGEAGAAVKALPTVVDHWMSARDMALFELVLQKVDAILKENQAEIQKLN